MNFQSALLPFEILSKIFLLLPPLQCFKLCVAFRFRSCYRYCIPHVPEMCMNRASASGCGTLLLCRASHNGHIAVVVQWQNISICHLPTTDSCASIFLLRHELLAPQKNLSVLLKL